MSRKSSPKPQPSIAPEVRPYENVTVRLRPARNTGQLQKDRRGRHGRPGREARIVRAVTSGRVSSSEQAEHGTSLVDQRRRLRARVLSDGNTFVAHREDGGASGASMDRRAMNEVLEMVLRGEVDVLYATKLDRLGRTLLGVLELLERVTTAGGHIRLIDEGIDTSTVAGRMLVQFMSVIAAFERDRIRERTVAGRVAAAESGSFVLSTAPYGYRVEGANRDRRLVVDEKEAAACRYIVTELVLGRGHAGEIAEALNAKGLRPRKARVWTADSVRGWAREGHVRRNLIGTAVYRGIAIPIPAIVTHGEAEQ